MTSAPHDRCAYCGAVLDPHLYFCSACATPYKPEEAVLPTVPRPRLTTGQLVAQKAPAVAGLREEEEVVVVVPVPRDPRPARVVLGY